MKCKMLWVLAFLTAFLVFSGCQDKEAVSVPQNGDESSKTASQIAQEYDGPRTVTTDGITYNFSYVRDESDWAGELRILYVFESEDGANYLWYESLEDARANKNPTYTDNICTDDGYLHHH